MIATPAPERIDRPGNAEPHRGRHGAAERIVLLLAAAVCGGCPQIQP